jgi:hypothetical protein
VTARPIVLPYHERLQHALHEAWHTVACIRFGLPVYRVEIDLGQQAGSDSHGHCKIDSEAVNLSSKLIRRQVIVMSLMGYLAADPRWDLPDGREASAWPPPRAWDAYIEPLENIGDFTSVWEIGEPEWLGILSSARALLADPEAQALAKRIAEALMDKQTLLPDDLARIQSPALDRVMAEQEVGS